jgi:hypothetical protein
MAKKSNAAGTHGRAADLSFGLSPGEMYAQNW